jgi:hypothetical protein
MLPGAHLSKKARKKLKSEPYKPLAPDYENKGQVAAKARQIAAGKVKPEVSDLTQEGKEARRQNRGRLKQIGDVYGGTESAIKAAIANAQQAYDNYISTSNAASQAALGNLSSALGSTRDANLKQATEVGGVLPTGAEAPLLTSATAGSLAQLGNAQSAGAIGLGPVESMGPAAAVGKAQALVAQGNKFKTLLDAIHEKRTAAKAKIGPAIAEAEKEINAEELAKASERNREGIARGQLENEGKSVGVSEEEAKTNRYNAKTARTQANTASAQGLKELKLKARELGISKQIEWAKIHNEEKQLEAAVTEAGTGAEKEAAEAVAAKYSSAVEAMLNYVGNTKPKLQQPRTLLNILMGLTTDKTEALEIMVHSGVPQMIKFAKTYLGLNKTPKQGRVGSSHR